MIDPQQTTLNQTSAPKIEISQTQQNASIAVSELELQVIAPNDPQQQVNINAKPIEAPINTSSFNKTENSINDVMARSEQLEIEESAPILETSLPNLTETKEDKGTSGDTTKTVSTNMMIAEPSYFSELSKKYKEAPNWRRLIG
jgi:hypothetical protein